VVLTESPGEQVVAGALFFCGNLSLPQDARDKRAVIGTASGLVLLANPVSARGWQLGKPSAA
jgi:hypothetical protein